MWRDLREGLVKRVLDDWELDASHHGTVFESNVIKNAKNRQFQQNWSV